jgi:hypothetical protein
VKVLDSTGQKSDSGNIYKRFESHRAVRINLLRPSEEKGAYFKSSTDYSQGSNKKRQKLETQKQIFNKNSSASVSSPSRPKLPKKFHGNMTMHHIRSVLPFESFRGMDAEPSRAKAESMVSQGLKMAPSKKDHKNIDFGDQTANGGSIGSPLKVKVKNISIKRETDCFLAKDKFVGGRDTRGSLRGPI